MVNVALHRRRGTSATRLNPGHYALSLGDKVLFGLTREHAH